MIRITGGRFRGRQIDSPKGQAVRPTTSFIRESMFSKIGPALIQSRFLDLFAGSGIVGVEALSRGATFVLAVEGTSAHCRILEKNRERLKLTPEDYEITCQDVFAWARRQQEKPPQKPYDIIFMDPPYVLEETVLEIVTTCFASGLLHPAGTLIWESRLKQPPVPEGAVLKDFRQYGSSSLAFIKWDAAN